MSISQLNSLIGVECGVSHSPFFINCTIKDISIGAQGTVTVQVRPLAGNTCDVPVQPGQLAYLIGDHEATVNEAFDVLRAA